MADRSKVGYICEHCGEIYSNQLVLCRKCNTKEKRAEMDKMNEDIFKVNGLKFKCGYCNWEKRQLENKNKEE